MQGQEVLLLCWAPATHYHATEPRETLCGLFQRCRAQTRPIQHPWVGSGVTMPIPRPGGPPAEWSYGAGPSGLLALIWASSVAAAPAAACGAGLGPAQGSISDEEATWGPASVRWCPRGTLPYAPPTRPTSLATVFRQDVVRPAWLIAGRGRPGQWPGQEAADGQE